LRSGLGLQILLKKRSELPSEERACRCTFRCQKRRQGLRRVVYYHKSNQRKSGLAWAWRERRKHRDMCGNASTDVLLPPAALWKVGERVAVSRQDSFSFAIRSLRDTLSWVWRTSVWSFMWEICDQNSQRATYTGP
jgi:hypothetical protein